MIVADTNIISYLFLPTNYSEKASQLFQVDPDWAAPELWRSEFRNVLALYMRQSILSLTEALALQDEAESLMTDREFSLPSVAVMNLVASSTCSVYDCEFVALARQLSITLVTQDKRLLKEFPETAVSLDEFLFQASA
ncbi:type II toxin-antitoxin system VapC family toxin [Methylomonas sp. HYX-M1]|uniref:type II toxin-antitoxin system VapC family toxin n=1 Tax=Methylomonas sp. HYX-M1 TaxID=3139307 RepID=UPI00345B9112